MANCRPCHAKPDHDKDRENCSPSWAKYWWALACLSHYISYMLRCHGIISHICWDIMVKENRSGSLSLYTCKIAASAANLLQVIAVANIECPSATINSITGAQLCCSSISYVGRKSAGREVVSLGNWWVTILASATGCCCSKPIGGQGAFLLAFSSSVKKL